mgnify:CR=1 FL=1
MLTEKKIKALKVTDRAYKAGDQRGLYILVKPSGGKIWRYKYRIKRNSKSIEKLLTLGSYPEISLTKARELHWEAYQLVKAGHDPSKNVKASGTLLDGTYTFGSIGKDWLETKASVWSDGHKARQIRFLKKDLAPLHDKEIRSIKPPDILMVLRGIEERGVGSTPRRVKQVASQIFRHGIALGLADSDPASVVSAALKPHKPKHFAAITNPRRLGPILRAFEGYKGSPIVRAALFLTPRLMVRPGELRRMKWEELDLETRLWIIPQSTMKKSPIELDHIVPLPSQACKTILNIKPLTGSSDWVFPNARDWRRPMSDNALLGALRRLDIGKDETCVHGFRATARTILAEEFDYPDHVLEAALSHAPKGAHGRAYNRTSFIEQRRRMLQHWSDHLDALKGQGTL